MGLEYTKFTRERQTELLNDIIDMMEDDYIDITASGHGNRNEADMFSMLINVVKDFKARIDNPKELSHEQIKYIRDTFVKLNLKECPLADESVLKFIARFIYAGVRNDRECIKQTYSLQKVFTNGFCWHFAHLLQNTFDGNGDVVHVSGPDNYNHFVWIYKDIPYDITGFVNIPDGYARTHEKFVDEEELKKFKHNY